MTTLATLVVRITADTTDYQTKLKAVSEIGNKMTTVGKKLSKAVTLPLLAIGTASVAAASNLNEARNKVQVVFGQSAKSVEAFAKTASKNLGMSSRAALEAAGTYGNLFTTMGMGQVEAAGMSTELVKLAADLGSFNNIKTDEALEKLRAGLVGETEPLRALGVNLTAAAVQAKAMEMGLVGADGQISQSALVQARYALILEQTKNAQGDFGRTAEGMANKTKTAQGSVEDMAASLGEKLLPYAIKAVDWVIKLADAFAKLPKPTQDAAIGVAAVALAAGPVMTVFGKLLQIGPGVITFLGSIGPLGWVVAAGIGVAVVAVKNLNDQVERGISDVDKAWKDYFARQIAQGKSAAEIAADYAKREAEVNKIWNERGDIGEEIGKAYTRMTKDESKFLSNQPLLQETVLKTSKSFDEYYGALIQASGGNVDLIDQSNPIVEMFRAKAEATWDAAHATDGLATSVTTTASTLSSYTDSVTMAYEAQQQLTDSNLTTVTALEAEKTAALEAASSIRDNLAGAVQALQSAQENWNLSVAGSAISAIQATKGLSDEQIRILRAATDSALGSTYTATDNMNAALATAVADFKATGDVSQYEATVQKIADDFATTLAPDIKTAQDAVDNLQHALDLLNNVPINIPVHVNVNYPYGGIPTSTGIITQTGAGGGGGGGGGGGNEPLPFAEGGGGIVPGGYPNDSYLVGLTSGETFTVTPPGGSPGSEVVINQYFSGNAEPEQVKTAARDGVLAAQRAMGKR